MHFVIIYDLKAEGTRKAELEDKIEKILDSYLHVKRLANLYIVKINNEIEWERIRKSLNGFANDIEENFYFVMTSPNPNPGKYNGILYRGEWDDVNMITMT